MTVPATVNSRGEMAFVLEPVTERGRQFVDLVERHAVEAAVDAASRDSTGTFPTDVFESMRTSGFIASCVPIEFGGLGLESLHDLAVGLSRLGAADGSTALAANMHFTLCFIAARNLRAAREADDKASVERLSAFMTLLGGGLIGMANTTEPGTDTRHPLLEATPVDGGYELRPPRAT